MKRSLWVAAALAPLTFAAAPQAGAQITEPITGAVTTPVTTSTAGTNGASPGDVTVEGGSVVLTPPTAASTTPLAAITGNSGNNITNAGTIGVGETTSYTDTNADQMYDSNNGVVGQYAAGGNRFGIVTGMGGPTPSTTNTVGSTPTATSIYNEGTITIIGENSAGVLIGTGGLNGYLSNTGTITVTGGNMNPSTNLNGTDVSYGVLALGAVNGPVTLAGTISATGANAQGVSLAGGVTGTTSGVANGVTVYGGITATGYRDPNGTRYASELNLLYQSTTTAGKAAAAAELLQGGPALNIGGSVAGGINILAADATTSTPAGVVTSYGSAPAILIGSANPITINPVNVTFTGTNGGTTTVTRTGNYGLVVAGTVTGAGTYQGFNGTGIQIGGNNPLQVSDNGAAASTPPPLGSGNDPTPASGNASAFGTVNVNGGIEISGSVSGTALNSVWTQGSNTVNGYNSAIGLRIGSGATANSLTLDVIPTTSSGTTTYSAGTLSATVYTNGTSLSAIPHATALQIDSGGSLATLTNNGGTISANVQGLAITGSNNLSPVYGGTIGSATAVLDNSGTLTSITNTGVISATVTPPTGTPVTYSSTTALNLSANTVGVTVTQKPYTGDPTAINSTTLTYQTQPAIVGDILFGSGAANLNLNSGTDTGAVTYGTGVGSSQLSTLTIDGGANLTGALSTNGGAVNVTVGDIHGAGTLNNTGTSVITTTGLTIGSNGAVLLTANPALGQNSYFDLTGTNGSASIANGASIGLNFISKMTLGTTTTYALVKTNSAGKLNATPSQIDTSLNGLLPYMYSGTLSASGGQLNLTVGVKTTQQLGFNQAESSAFNAVYQAFSTDPAVTTAVLGKTDRASFVKLYDQFLPDYAGGPFESLVAGQQAVARTQAEAPLKLQSDEAHGWVEEITFINDHDNSSGGGYNAAGFGMVGGIEAVRGDSAFGVTAAFLNSSVQDSAQTNLSALSASVIEAGVYWRASSDGLSINASLNGGFAFFDSRRLVYDPSTTPAVYKEADARWNGGIVSGAVSVAYQFDFGRYYLRPELAADYIMLYESGYSEAGGGNAVDLTVGSRTNQQASARAQIVFGARYGTTTIWRPELTLGWREVVSGGPANTTAYFTNGGTAGAAGTPFTLSPDFKDKGGLLARLGVRAGGNYADFTADAGGQFGNGYQTYDARAVARFLF